MFPEQLPYSRVYVNTGDPIEEENLVEFRLLFEGELLPSSNTKRRATEKHVIRRAFHPQLARLWTMNKNLRFLAIRSGGVLPGVNPDNEQAYFQRGINVIGEKWNRAGCNFVPLVTAEMTLRCSLDILLLRPEEDRFIFTSGDIDGQIKTLFDALRIPKNKEEFGGFDEEKDEQPFFCLLEDDRLISEVRVNADQLLLLPQHKEVKANDSFVIIHVKLNHNPPRTLDNYFG